MEEIPKEDGNDIPQEKKDGIEANAPAYFDPKAELLALKKTLGGLERSEKEQAVETYKVRLGEYYSLLADLNTDIEQRIRFTTVAFSESGIIDSSFLKDKISQFRGKLAPEIVSQYEAFFDKIIAINRYLQDFKNKNQGRDERVIFEDLFGFTPKGSVNMVVDSINVTVKCEDQTDFVQLFGSDLTDENIQDLERLGAFAGVSSSDSRLEGLIIAVHSDAKLDVLTYKQIMLHEQKHVLDIVVAKVTGARLKEDIIRDLLEYKVGIDKMFQDETIDFDNDDFFLELMQDFFRKGAESMREGSEILAKMEIFAYMKNGLTTEELFAVLSDGKYYKVLNQQVVDEEGAKLSQFIAQIDFSETDKKMFESTFRNISIEQSERYLSALRSALGVIQSFRDLGVSDGKIIGFFQNEPLSQWKKIYDRTKSLYTNE